MYLNQTDYLHINMLIEWSQDNSAPVVEYKDQEVQRNIHN